MRLCPCRQVPLVKRLRVGIEARDLVPMHDRNIDITIRSRSRIAGEFGRRHLPFADLSLNLWPHSWCDTIVRPASPGYSSRDQDQPNENTTLYVWHSAIVPFFHCAQGAVTACNPIVYWCG